MQRIRILLPPDDDVRHRKNIRRILLEKVGHKREAGVLKKMVNTVVNSVLLHRNKGV